MSFLGYPQKDYVDLLPKNIQNVTDPSVIQNSAGTSTPKQSGASLPKTTTENVTKALKPITHKSRPKIRVVFQTTPKISTTQTSTPTTLIPGSNTLQIQKVFNPQPQILSALANLSQKIQASTANIYCVARRGPYIEQTSGSAVEIDPSGVYLTNAHVAVYVMLADTEPDGTVLCYIREGSPAQEIYQANIVYLPSAWVYANRNAYSITTRLTGTGEKDYAIIKRGELLTNNPPAEWSSSIETQAPIIGETIYLSGYPVFDQSVLTSALVSITDQSSITNIYNLSNTNGALFDSAPTTMAQIGSSGGGVFDSNGNLLGIMDAEISSVPGEAPSERIVGINYIENDLQSDTGQSLQSFISNAASESQKFLQNSAPALSNILISNQ